MSAVWHRILKYYSPLDTLRWWGFWVSSIATGHACLLIRHLTDSAFQALSAHMFSASAALLAVEVAGFALIIALLSPKIVEQTAPRVTGERNVLMRLVVPYFVAALTWAAAVVAFGVCLLLCYGKATRGFVCGTFALGTWLFLFSLLSTITLLAAVVDILEAISLFLAKSKPAASESPPEGGARV